MIIVLLILQRDMKHGSKMSNLERIKSGQSVATRLAFLKIKKFSSFIFYYIIPITIPLPAQANLPNPSYNNIRLPIILLYRGVMCIPAITKNILIIIMACLEWCCEGLEHRNWQSALQQNGETERSKYSGTGSGTKAAVTY